MNAMPFIKMHGLGNDFVVIDGRAGDLTGERAIDAARARAIADRRTGVGCDQLLMMLPAVNGNADIYMEIRNSDGSPAEACGNGTRCVASLLMDDSGADSVDIETVAGILHASRDAAGDITVDMGAARLEWSEIPLAAAADTLHLDIAMGPLRDPVAVNIGNPHAVFFVDDAEAVDLEALGPPLETHAMFPEHANIEVVSVLGPDKLRMRVWERGDGITRACGSGACAVAVAAARRGVTGRRVEVVLDGGTLRLEWRDDGHILMTGPATLVYRGTFAPSFVDA